MVSAQKHQMPTERPADNPSPAATTGFAKVFNSVHGLQQRLNDFSVEDVSRAQMQTHEMLGKLGALQDRIAGVIMLRSAFKDVDARIAERPAETFDGIDAASLENHPELRAIIDAAKLIRMHRALRAAQASAESVSLGQPTKTPLETQPAAITSVRPAVLEKKMAADKTTADIAAAQSAPPVGKSPDEKLAPVAVRDDIADLRLDKPSNSLNASEPLPCEPAAGSEKPAESKTEDSRFDERLLADLIQTYGELAPLKSSAGRVEDQPSQAPLSPSVTSQATDLVPVKSVKTTLPTTQARDTAPAAAPAASRPADAAPPASPSSSKSRGEIDRQLKNIIKDYGEYDLYSQQPSTNIKTAALAAAAALGLLLGGFYLLKAPSVTPPAAIHQAVPGGQSASPTTNP
jgi:hypothetical protein